MTCRRLLTTLTNKSILHNAGVLDPHLICIYIYLICTYVCMLQQRFWLNRSTPQNEFLKKGITKMYANCLKNTCNRLKLLSYTRSAILPKMNSFIYIFRGLCYNICVFTFHHVHTAIFAELLSVIAYEFTYLLLLSFWTIVLQHIDK